MPEKDRSGEKIREHRIRRSGVDAEWVIIDRKFRELEKREQMKRQKSQRAAEIFYCSLGSLYLRLGLAHTLSRAERIERRSQFSSVSKNRAF